MHAKIVVASAQWMGQCQHVNGTLTKHDMSTYYTNGHRAVDGSNFDSQSQIASHFAELKARREFGRRAAVGACRIGSYAQDGSFFEVQAFIGKRRKFDVEGHNVTFTVYRK